MNREQTIEAIKVMQAWVDGKVIQVGKQKAPWLHPNWTSLGGSASGEHVVWDFTSISIQYRIKPAPLERWIVTDGAGNETLYFHDPRPVLAVLETAAMFVEVTEDEVKPACDAGLSPATIIPASVRPLLRQFMVGDKGKTVGGWAYSVRAATDNGHLYVEHNDNGLPSQVRRQYEMIHAKDGSAGAAGPDHQLLTPDEFLP